MTQTQAPVAPMTQDEALALLATMRAEMAAKDAEIARLAAAVPAPKAAFVPVVTVTLRPAGYDANVGTPREGMFVSQQAKLEVSVTRSSGNPVVLRENLAIWRAITTPEALAAIAEALA